MNGYPQWWTAEKGAVNQAVLHHVRGVDAQQGSLYNKFIRCAALYDMPHQPRTMGDFGQATDGRMHENAIASAVNTVAAQIATTDIRAVFDTDDADWSTQRRAKYMEWYAEELTKLLEILEKCQDGFRAGAAVKGTALNKVYIDAFDRIVVEPCLVDDIVVDEIECRSRRPMQMHHRIPVDKDELKARFPKFEKQIDAAGPGGAAQNPRLWAGYRPIHRNDVMAVESWRVPYGVQDHDGYKPGRHTYVIDGLDLLDEPWHEEPPFATLHWEKPTQGWYGIGLVERSAGLQRALNRRNLQIERQNDQGAYPTTWVPLADASLKTQVLTQNQIGTIAVYRGAQPPTTVLPQAVASQTYQDAERIAAKIFENTGVSRMAAQSVKPPGVETGVALREYRDQTTQRFALQEKGYERFVIQTIVLVLGCCKKLGSKAPTMTRKTRFGKRDLSWAKVNMSDLRVQISAASTLSRTRAGRLQSVIEWAQAGIISQEDARRLIDHPDLERAMSLYTAAIENCDEVIEEIAEGKVVMPEPFMNLKLLVWRAQQQYLTWRGAPEAILENLRALIVQAAWMSAQAGASGAVGPDVSGAEQTAGGAMQPGVPMQPGMPGELPPGALPMLPPGAGVEPMAAFAPQAMSLVGGVGGAG